MALGSQAPICGRHAYARSNALPYKAGELLVVEPDALAGQPPVGACFYFRLQGPGGCANASGDDCPSDPGRSHFTKPFNGTLTVGFAWPVVSAFKDAPLPSIVRGSSGPRSGRNDGP